MEYIIVNFRGPLVKDVGWLVFNTINTSKKNRQETH